MFRFLTRNPRLIDERILSGETSSFTILPAGRASIHPDGAVFLNVERGVIFKSNRVGSRIWQGVLNQESLAAMAAQISRESIRPKLVSKASLSGKRTNRMPTLSIATA